MSAASSIAINPPAPPAITNFQCDPSNNRAFFEHKTKKYLLTIDGNAVNFDVVAAKIMELLETTQLLGKNEGFKSITFYRDPPKIEVITKDNKKHAFLANGGAQKSQINLLFALATRANQPAPDQMQVQPSLDQSQMKEKENKHGASQSQFATQATAAQSAPSVLPMPQQPHLGQSQPAPQQTLPAAPAATVPFIPLSNEPVREVPQFRLISPIYSYPYPSSNSRVSSSYSPVRIAPPQRRASPPRTAPQQPKPKPAPSIVITERK